MDNVSGGLGYKEYHIPTLGSVSARTLGPLKRVDCEIPRQLKRGCILIRVWKPLYSRQAFKTMRLTTIRNRSKQTISASCRLGLLQMVSDLDTKRSTRTLALKEGGL